MKVKGAVAALFLAGVWASFALAGRPPDAGHGRDSSGSAATTSETTIITTTVTVTTTTAPAPRFLVLCHETGSAAHSWVKIKVPPNAVWTHVSHGDVLLTVRGGCPFAGGTRGSKAHGHDH